MAAVIYAKAAFGRYNEGDFIDSIDSGDKAESERLAADYCAREPERFAWVWMEGDYDTLAPFKEGHEEKRTQRGLRPETLRKPRLALFLAKKADLLRQDATPRKFQVVDGQFIRTRHPDDAV